MSPQLSLDRVSDISDLAEAVVASGPGLIDPIAIADDLGISMSFNDYGEAFDGLLEARGGRFHIYCNLRRVEKRDSQRARFTLGHELGHYFIDDHRNALLSGTPPHPSMCEFQSKNPVEMEADTFAASLLMPWSRFRPAVQTARPGLHGVLDLSASYRTSVTATALRYVAANPFVCAMIKWATDGYSWKRLSPRAFSLGFRKTTERIEALPPKCPTARVLRGEVAGLAEAGTTAATWFPFIPATSERNGIWIEQALSLGRFGALTFLRPESASVAPFAPR
jgi:hypothetical protein